MVKYKAREVVWGIIAMLKTLVFFLKAMKN